MLVIHSIGSRWKHSNDKEQYLILSDDRYLYFNPNKYFCISDHWVTSGLKHEYGKEYLY